MPQMPRLTSKLVHFRAFAALAPDDYDVIDADGRDIGRIFKARAGVPPDHTWMWTITGAIVAPDLPNHGFAATRDEAKAALAETWRAWLASTRQRPA